MAEPDKEWDALATQLEALVKHIRATDGKNRLYAFADGFLAAARAYHRVILAEGKTSIRVEAALRALTLSTPKSKIQSFLEDA